MRTGTDQLDLRNRAIALIAKRKYDKALAIYRQLEALDPTDPRWPHRAGDARRKLGDQAGAIDDYGRAALRYADQGFALKAIGLCKVVLALEPGHRHTQENLAQLVADQQRSWKAPSPQLAAEQLEASVLVTLDRSPVPEEVSPPEAARREESDAAGQHVIVQGAASSSTSATNPPAYSDWTRSFDEVRQTSDGWPAVPALVDPRESNFEIVLEVDEGLADLDLRQIYSGGREPPATQLFAVPLHAPEPAVRRDGHALPNAAVRLPPVPLFSWLDSQALRELIERLEVRTYFANETVIEEGTAADSLYVLLEGQLVVCQGANPAQVVNRLKEGAFFGEVALLTGGRRTASVIAETSAAVFVLSRAIVNELVRRDPRVLSVMLRFLRDRLIHSQIERFSLQQLFPAEERARLANCFRLFQAEAGTTLMKRGSLVDALGLVLHGEVSATELSDGGATLSLALEQGDFFGVHALLTGRPAPATVSCGSRAWLLVLDRQTLAYVSGGYPKLLIYLAELAHTRRLLPGMPLHNFHLL